MHNTLHSNHFIFTPENAKYKATSNPSIEDVTKFLNSQGEDAQIVNGFYDKPERYILVQNPKNVGGLFQMAKQFGQKSAIHSKDGQHQMRYLNGPEEGKIVSGAGTNFFKEKPANYFTEIHTVDGPMYFQHNFNFPETPDSSDHLDKSESLNKAPLRYEGYKPDEGGLPDLAHSESHKEMKRSTLPNGLEYRQYKSIHAMKNKPSQLIHALYDPQDDSQPLAYMQTEHEEDPMAEDGRHPNVVTWAEVNPEHRGKGLGRQMYMAALTHGVGQITSGANISPEAQKAWKSFKTIPGLGGKIGRYPSANADYYMTPGESASFENDRHHVFVRDKRQLDMNKMFHKVDINPKLAASEDMKKSIPSLDAIRTKLESPSDEETIEMPEHMAIQWSVPQHKWNTK